MPYGSLMNLRKGVSIPSSKPRTSSRRFLNSLFIDSLSRIRMTQSSPGNGGRPEVDGAAGWRELEAAVLRDALLGDVELRHDLDARDDRGVMALVDRVERLVEDAVDAVFDDHLVVARLDVNVRGAALDE